MLDALIVNGNVVDGTGAPARPRLPRHRRRAVVGFGDRDEPGGRRIDAAGWPSPRVHRPAQPLRRPGVLGPDAHARPACMA